MAVKIADGSATNRTDQKFDPWFNAKKWDAHGQVMSTILYLRSKQPASSKQHWHNFRLYAGFEQMSITGGRVGQQIMPTVYDRYKLTMNVARRCVDTVHGRITQNKPKPTPLTVGGVYSSMKRAKMLDRLGQGMSYHADVPRITREACKDAEVFGTGCVHTYEDWDGMPACERVFIDEIVVDEADGLNRRPRILFRYRAIDKLELLANPKYKKFKDKIQNAALPEENGFLIVRNGIADQVGLAEAWKLPSNPYSNDGRHVICLNNVTLLDEPWEKTYHPFSFIRWCDRSLGFFGQGITEQVSGIQFEINALLLKIQEQMRLSGPKVFLERGASIVPQHINNELWGIIEYSGQAPTFATFDAVSADQFQQLDRLNGQAFQEIGISQLAAHGEKPAGLNSGKALLTYNDLETSALSVFGSEWEDLHIDIYRKQIDIARESHMKPDVEGNPRVFKVRYPVKARGDRFLREVKWSDVNVSNQDFTLQVFPTSMLPSTPAGKLQAIGDMLDRGMLKGDQAISLLDFPDLERITSLITAAIDDIDMMTEEMLDNGMSLTPEPFSNLEMAIERMSSQLLRAKVQEYPDDRQELLRNYISEAVKKNDALKAKSAQMSQQVGAPSMATPALPNGMQAPPAPVQGAPGMAA